MSTAEILAELPHLPLEEIEAIHLKAEELLHRQAVAANPELLAAIDEADASPESGDIPAETIRKRVSEWARSK